MATPTIVWNGNTISFSRPITAWTHSIKTDTTWRVSVDGHKRAHCRKYLWNVGLRYKNITQAQEQELLCWWAWAQTGGYYSIAKDGTKTLNTTLSVDATTAQAVVSLNSTSGVVAGDVLLLTRDDREYFEVVTVYSVGVGSITATANLKRSFYAGDSCRHLYYYPRVVSKDNKYPLKATGEGSDNMFDLDMDVEEDLE
jgi:hypothetical protein